MAKTMFTALFLGALSVGAAQDQAQCAVDGATAMNDLTNAAMFTWAASKRCGDAAESQVKCEIDITSAAQGATNMIATIVGAVAECGAISTASAECAAAVTGLTSAAAGLAAASGGIVDGCPNSLPTLLSSRRFIFSGAVDPAQDTSPFCGRAPPPRPPLTPHHSK